MMDQTHSKRTIVIIIIVVTIITATLGETLATEACPASCICHMTNQTCHVTCANQSLTSIPDGIPENVTLLELDNNGLTSLYIVFQMFAQVHTLDLSFNELSVINVTDFNASFNLQSLDLSNNHIVSISSGAFQYTTKLQALNLSNNSLRSVDGATFSGTSNIQHLNLSHNAISLISSKAFLNMDKLEALDLSYNSIRDIPKALFRTLHSLTLLKLQNNMIAQFDDAAIFSTNSTLLELDLSYNDLSNVSINVLSGLESLNLAYNNFEAINSAMFEHLENLTSLVLDGNPVSTLKTAAFEKLKNLRRLSLSNMPKLAHLSQMTFDGLASIEVLLICNNPRLSFIHKSLFSQLGSISTIDLSFNNITSIQNGTFPLTDSVLTTVDIQGNRFICDCAIEWLIEELQGNRSIIIQDQDKLECESKTSNQTQLLLSYDPETLHCSEVTIANHSSDSAFRIGKPALLVCEAYSDPSPEITWITPRKRVFHYHDFYHSPIEYVPLEETLAHIASSHSSDEQPAYLSESESRPDRIQILKDGSLYIDFVMRGDAGPYTCIAKNPRNSTEVIINLTLDYSVINDVQIWSLIIGFSSAGSFFLLNLIYSLTLAAIRRCISQRRRERICHMIETIDHYKTSQLGRIKENYNNQVGKIRDQYHYQLGRLREHHQTQMSRMGRMREGASQKVDRLKENYNNQLGRLKDYSSSQLEQIREKYNSQVDKIKDYGNDKLDRLHEKYKLKQQHVIRLFEMMNLDKCRTAFESECVRTESMILQSDVFNTEVPLHSPIDSVSVSDSEYMTATSTESSKYSSQRNIYQTPGDDDSDNALAPMNPYLGEDCTAIDIDDNLEIELAETSFTTVSEASKLSKTDSDSDQLDSLPKHVSEVPFPPGKRWLPSKRYNKPKHKHKRSSKSRQRKYAAEDVSVDEMEELYKDICYKKPKSDNSSGKKPINDTLMLTDEEPSCSSRSVDDPRCMNLPVSKKFTSKDRPLSISKPKCQKERPPSSSKIKSENAETQPNDNNTNMNGKCLGNEILEIENTDNVPGDTVGELVV